MNWKSALCQLVFSVVFSVIAYFCGFRTMAITAFALIMGYIYAKDMGWLTRVNDDDDKHDPDDEKDDSNYGTKFVIVDMGDGKFSVTRSNNQRSHGFPLTRLDLFKNDMDLAEFFYTHEFMCCGWASPDDRTRPCKEEWLAREPYEFEVDTVLSKFLYGERAYITG